MRRQIIVFLILATSILATDSPPSIVVLEPQEEESRLQSLTDSCQENYYLLKQAASSFQKQLADEMQVHPQFINQMEAAFADLIGDNVYFLLGYSDEQTEIGCYGEKESSKPVRITFINGILTDRDNLLINLAMLSQTHGNAKIHYVFRPTEGWSADLCRAFLIKTAFQVGFRSIHAHLLAHTWRALIEEMGGIQGDGVIIHYAHSIGGSETDRARDLLSPEEQRKIRVITFGSPTLIPNVGFQQVVNIVSRHDGVTSFLLNPFGWMQHYWHDAHSTVEYYGQFFNFPHIWPLDHQLGGPSYGEAIRKLGEQFCLEFFP